MVGSGMYVRENVYQTVLWSIRESKGVCPCPRHSRPVGDALAPAWRKTAGRRRFLRDELSIWACADRRLDERVNHGAPCPAAGRKL